LGRSFSSFALFSLKIRSYLVKIPSCYHWFRSFSDTHWLIHKFWVIVIVFLRFHWFIIHKSSEVIRIKLFSRSSRESIFSWHLWTNWMPFWNGTCCSASIRLRVKVLAYYSFHMTSVPRDVLVSDFMWWASHPVDSVLTPITVHFFICHRFLLFNFFCFIGIR